MSPRTFRVAKLIGRRDFAGAIAEIEAGLVIEPDSMYWLGLLATCRHWSARDDEAIAVSLRILQIDAHDFEALKLLGEIYVRRDDRDNAARFVRRALENYPQQMPGAPPRFSALVRAVAKAIPVLRRLKEEDYRFIEDPDAANREWFSWAKRYLSWHDSVTGDATSPLVH